MNAATVMVLIVMAMNANAVWGTGITIRHTWRVLMERMMADFVAISRSNYFRVLDPAFFRSFIEEMNLEHQVADADPKERIDALPGPYFMVYPEMGDWPSYDDEDNEIDFVKRLSKHLPPGEVAILHTIGNEKLRYLNHAIVAINASGVIQHHSQENFYDELNRLGHKFTRADIC